MIGPAIPASSIPEELLKKLQSEKYDRIVMNVSADYEGKETFALVKKNQKNCIIYSSIQLGTTVDYAILFTERYKENRQTLNKKEKVLWHMMPYYNSSRLVSTLLQLTVRLALRVRMSSIISLTSASFASAIS